ncbi:hypothetical protein CRG98_047338 [Punica granatum]|uniref:Extensin-like n=1 Tax=Punica granatum TaxID=22663 RepID=A0A2I0HKJ9_PUNGR|nr:hypothetical protein CRG98_047338 [Punica granatum]
MTRPSETLKPLVGSLRVPLFALIDSAESSPDRNHKLELLRPSGRPQGKVRVSLALRERRSYSSAPDSSSYFSSASPPPPPPPPYPYARDYRDFFSSPRYAYSDQFPGYYYHHYAVPPPPAWPHFSRLPVHSPAPAGGPSAPPSAPVDFCHPTATADPKLVPPPPHWISDHSPSPSTYLTRSNSYNAMLSGPTAPEVQRPPYGHETTGSVADALGGMSLGEGSRHEADYAWRKHHAQSSSEYHRGY